MTARPDPQRVLLQPSRIVALVVFIACVAIGGSLIVSGRLSSPGELAADLRSTVDGLPRPAAWLVVTLAAVVCLVCLTPSPIVIGACGLLLGAAAGLAAGIFAIGAAVAIERLLAASIIGRLVHARLARTRPDVDERLARWGLPGVVLVRALGAPTTVIAWASSATALRPALVSAGCMLGSIPRGLAYATIGSAGASLLRPGDWTWHIWASLGLLVVLFAATMALAMLQSRRQ